MEKKVFIHVGLLNLINANGMTEFPLNPIKIL